jgi:hypothetical protein
MPAHASCRMVSGKTGSMSEAPPSTCRICPVIVPGFGGHRVRRPAARPARAHGSPEPRGAADGWRRPRDRRAARAWPPRGWPSGACERARPRAWGTSSPAAHGRDGSPCPPGLPGPRATRGIVAAARGMDDQARRGARPRARGGGAGAPAGEPRSSGTASRRLRDDGDGLLEDLAFLVGAPALEGRALGRPLGRRRHAP